MNWIKENKAAAIIILLILLAVIGYFTNWFGLVKKKNGTSTGTGTRAGINNERRGINLNDTGDLLRRVESHLRKLGTSQSIIDSRIIRLKQKLSKNPTTPQRFVDYWGCLEGCQGHCDEYNYGLCYGLL